MANKVEIVLNSAGVRELLQSGEIAAACESAARTYLQKLPSGYKLSTYTGRTRVNVSVYTDTDDAAEDNVKNNTMLRALGGGGE